MISVVNITVSNNVDFRREFAAVDDDGKTRDDLYLSQLFFQVRRSANSELILLRAATDPTIGGLQFLAPVKAGRFVLSLPWKSLSDAGPGTFSHDLIEVTPLNVRRPLWEGTFTIKQGVTR